MSLRLLAVVLLALSASFANDNLDAQNLAIRAINLVDIRSLDSKPFQMEVDFRAQTNSSWSGHLTWKWVAKDLWSRQIAMGSYSELEVRNKDFLYIKRNTPAAPRRISELKDLLELLPFDFESIKVKKQTAEIIDETRDDVEVQAKFFGGYRQFHEHRYPRHLVLWADGGTALDVRVVSLRDQNFDKSAFLPPSGAISRRQCDHMIPPIAIETPSPALPIPPSLPSRAHERGPNGIVKSTLTVLRDGSVTNIYLVVMGSRHINQVAEDTLKTWRFEPARCGAEPIDFDMNVAIYFEDFKSFAEFPYF